MNPELKTLASYNYVSYQVASCQKYYEPKQSEGNWLKVFFRFLYSCISFCSPN